jgi:hypothetical protein
MNEEQDIKSPVNEYKQYSQKPLSKIKEMNISKNISNREDIEDILIKYILKEKNDSNKDLKGFDYGY